MVGGRCSRGGAWCSWGLGSGGGPRLPLLHLQGRVAPLHPPPLPGRPPCHFPLEDVPPSTLEVARVEGSPIDSFLGGPPCQYGNCAMGESLRKRWLAPACLLAEFVCTCVGLRAFACMCDLLPVFACTCVCLQCLFARVFVCKHLPV